MQHSTHPIHRKNSVIFSQNHSSNPPYIKHKPSTVDPITNSITDIGFDPVTDFQLGIQIRHNIFAYCDTTQYCRPLVTAISRRIRTTLLHNTSNVKIRSLKLPGSSRASRTRTWQITRKRSSPKRSLCYVRIRDLCT